MPVALRREFAKLSPAMDRALDGRGEQPKVVEAPLHSFYAKA